MSLSCVLCHPMILPIVLPFAVGLVCLLLPKFLRKLLPAIAVATSAATVYLVWPLFKSGEGLLEIGKYLSLRIDGLSAFTLLATTAFGLLISIYSIGYMSGKKRQGEYYAYLLWTISASCGALLANDYLLLLSFWGFLGITLYMMIGIGGPDASAAAKKTFIIIGGSDCVLMLGIAIIWVLTGSMRMDGPALALTGRAPVVAFLCIAIAALAKAGAMPFHTWVPDCAEKAPVSVTAFLPASLDKLLGIYLLARAATGLFTMNGEMNSLLMFIGAATVVLAVMMAIVQHDLKRLLSYHAVSQVGYMVLGIGTGVPIGIAGGLFHMLNNAIYKSCLFLSAGAVEKRTGTTDLDKLGGLARKMPVTFGACIVTALAISGIPPLNGFVSKWMVYQGLVEAGKAGGSLWVIWLAAAMLGSALTLASFVKVLHATFLCKPSPKLQKEKIREVGITMWLPMITLAAACVIFGVMAYRLPLRFMIFPAIQVPVLFNGTWWAGPASGMLLAGILLGGILYLISTGLKTRECGTYIGGEVLEQDVEVTGVDFYRTIQDMSPLKSIYQMAERKFFDLYDVGIGFLFYFVGLLRKAHTGRLPVYLTWVVAGLLVLLYVMRIQ